MPEITSIAVGVPPAALPMRFALEKGYFEEQGLDRVTLDAYMRANDMTPLLDGRVAFLVAGWPTAARTMAETGINLLAVAGFAVAQSNWAGVLVLADSPIRGPEALVAAQIGVPGLGSSAHELVWDILGQLGADRSNVQFVPIPPPALGQALASGQVDAICLPDPYYTTFKRTLGARVVLNLFDKQWGWEHQPQSAVWTTCRFAQTNPGTVSALRAALEKGVEYVRNHPVEARAMAQQAITKLPGVDPAGSYVFSEYETKIDVAEVQRKLDVHNGVSGRGEHPRVTAAQLVTCGL